MRRDRLLQFLLIATTAGCAPTQQAVFVNLDSLLVKEAPRETEKTPSPPAPAGSTSVKFPGRPAETIHLESDADRVRHITEVLRIGREEALRDLTARLRAAYQRQVRKLEADKLAELEPKHREAMAGVYGKFRSIFERYADQRGPFVIRLALLAGFPDPDPRSESRPTNAPRTVRDRFEESKGLRAKIADLDAAYEKEISTLLDEQDQVYAAELLALRIEIEKARAEADARANEEARQQVQQEAQELNLELAGRSSLTVPGKEPSTQVLPGQGRLAAAPPLKSPTPEQRLADERAEIEGDLGIWLAQNGYRRSPVAQGARDATEEFRAWRQSWRAGR